MENLRIRGVGGPIMVINYLNNRCQYMKLYGTISDTQVLTCGVPQGSIFVNVLKQINCV